MNCPNIVGLCIKSGQTNQTVKQMCMKQPKEYLPINVPIMILVPYYAPKTGTSY